MELQSSISKPSTLTGRRGFLGILGALFATPNAFGATHGRGMPSSQHGGITTASLRDERDTWLKEWANEPRIPVRQSEDPMTAHLLAHAIKGQSLALFYSGGSHPGRMRRFSPDLLFSHEGSIHVYVSGFCHQEQAPRILRLDRIALA